MREFRLPPRSEDSAILGYYAASSGDFFTEVSGQLIGPIFKVQESLDYHYSLRSNPEAGSAQKVCFSNLTRNTDNSSIVVVLLSHSRRRGEQCLTIRHHHFHILSSSICTIRPSLDATRSAITLVLFKMTSLYKPR